MTTYREILNKQIGDIPPGDENDFLSYLPWFLFIAWVLYSEEIWESSITLVLALWAVLGFRWNSWGSRRRNPPILVSCPACSRSLLAELKETSEGTYRLPLDVLVCQWCGVSFDDDLTDVNNK